MLERAGGDADALESAIANYELAFRMQSAVPELMDLAGETRGDEEALRPRRRVRADADRSPRECLLARRLVERGVRFVELTCPNLGHDRWDQHAKLKKGHEDNARAVDQPIAGLLKDLKSRGLLDEHARRLGRRVRPHAVRAGHATAATTTRSASRSGSPAAASRAARSTAQTDEYGYKAVEGKCQIHDLHATMLHLLGVDHTRLTFRFGGRDMRLTDVHGELITPILA